MSESYPNPFFSDRSSGIGPAVSSLVQAFAPNPVREARTGALLSQMDYDRARTDRVRAQGAAGQAAGARLRAGSVDPATLAQVFADVITGADPQMLAALPGFIRGFGGAAGAAPDRMAQLQQGAGQDWISTEVGRRFQEQNNLAQAFGVADRNNAGALARERVQQDGLDRRMAPEINPGNVVVVPPNSPLMPRATPDGRIAGPPAIDRAALRPPMDINGADARAIDEGIATNLPDGAQLTPEALALIRRRAAELYQVTRNMPAAVQDAVREFMSQNPPRADSSWNPFSARRYGVPTAPAAPPARSRDTGGPSSLPTAPTEGAAPAAAARPAALPPEGTRVRQNGREFIIRNGRAEPLT